MGGYIYSRTFYWKQSGLKSTSLKIDGAQKGCYNVSQAYEDEQLPKPFQQVKVFFKTVPFYAFVKNQKFCDGGSYGNHHRKDR